MKIKIQENLAPETAEELGYIWWQDVIYDPDAPQGAMADIVKLIESGDWALGKCASLDPVDMMVGLYKKVKP